MTFEYTLINNHMLEKYVDILLAVEGQTSRVTQAEQFLYFCTSQPRQTCLSCKLLLWVNQNCLQSKRKHFRDTMNAVDPTNTSPTPRSN